MPISVKHTIKLSENIKIARDGSIYRQPIGDPPPFHVGCTCQWEAWAHSRVEADYHLASHRNAQLMRGNSVESILPDVDILSTPLETQPEVEEPSLADKIKAVALKEEGITIVMGTKGYTNADLPEPMSYPDPIGTSASKGLKTEVE